MSCATPKTASWPNGNMSICLSKRAMAFASPPPCPTMKYGRGGSAARPWADDAVSAALQCAAVHAVGADAEMSERRRRDVDDAGGIAADGACRKASTLHDQERRLLEA